ncbi:hypothetical protein D3C86_1950580 [compost metagenome]
MTEIVFGAGFPAVNEAVPGGVCGPQAQGGEDFVVRFERRREHPHKRIEHQQANEQQDHIANAGVDLLFAQRASHLTFRDASRRGKFLNISHFCLPYRRSRTPSISKT